MSRWSRRIALKLILHAFSRYFFYRLFVYNVCPFTNGYKYCQYKHNISEMTFSDTILSNVLNVFFRITPNPTQSRAERTQYPSVDNPFFSRHFCSPLPKLKIETFCVIGITYSPIQCLFVRICKFSFTEDFCILFS